MEKPQQYLLFQLAKRWCALPLVAVERVLPAIEITPLPEAPWAVSGVINLAGEIVPVFALRRRFGLPERPVQLNDRLILAITRGAGFARRVALLIDAVHDVVTVPPAQVSAAGVPAAAPSLVPGLRLIRGVLPMADELVVIYDLDAFLSAAEEAALNTALQQLQEQEQ
jgi:purine-binding chemotaxis protein CheW